MQLRKILYGLEYKLLSGSVDMEVSDISYNTKNMSHQNVFVCIKGFDFDSHSMIDKIIAFGIRAVVVEKTDTINKNIIEGVTIIKVGSTKKALSIMSLNYFDNPQRKLITVGITGTKGKTTTAYMIKKLLDAGGRKTGLMGTIEVNDGKNVIPALNTTPASYEICKHMSNMVKNGCKCMVMEVSSQALMLDRVYGLQFDYGLFTNISKDHIGEKEHKSFEEYICCKKKLFYQCRRAIVNIDDNILRAITVQSSHCLLTVSLHNKAAYRGSDIHYIFDNYRMGIEYRICKRKIFLNMLGIFNAYNSLMAIAVCSEIMGRACVFKVCDTLESVSVKGRLEKIKNGVGRNIIIDYAHNGYSLKNVLYELRKYKPDRIITVFGCGGNRDKSRRFDMGAVAAAYSDISIVTSDNPRFEPPLQIINDIVWGFEKSPVKRSELIIIEDRKEAIKKALHLAGRKDIILLAGKGHELYQEIKGVKYPMDERELIKLS